MCVKALSCVLALKQRFVRVHLYTQSWAPFQLQWRRAVEHLQACLCVSYLVFGVCRRGKDSVEFAGPCKETLLLYVLHKVHVRRGH